MTLPAGAVTERTPTGSYRASFPCAHGEGTALLQPVMPSIEPGARLPPRLLGAAVLTQLIEYRGVGSVDRLADELLAFCADAATRGADVRHVVWSDGAACVVIRTPDCPPLNYGAMRFCYHAARLHMEGLRIVGAA